MAARPRGDMDKGDADILRAETGRGARMLGLNEQARGSSDGSKKVNGLDRWIAKKILSLSGMPRVTLELWDGKVAAVGEDPVTKLRFADRGALYGLILKSDISFGDAFSGGRTTNIAQANKENFFYHFSNVFILF